MLALAARGLRQSSPRRFTTSAAMGAQTVQLSTSQGPLVTGRVNDLHFDFSKAHVGQVLEIPYEITVSSSWREHWHASFYQHDRLFTSSQHAKSIHLKDALMPFSMVLFLAGSMTHVQDDVEVLNIGFKDAVYERPVIAGDTVTKTFTIRGLRETSAGRSLFDVRSELFNTRGDRLFTADHQLLLPEPPKQRRSVASNEGSANSQGSTRSEILNHIVNNVHDMPAANSLMNLQPGDLLLHGLVRPIGVAATQSLASLFRMTHPLIFNTARYQPDDMLVPWGLVLAASHACSARSMYEVVHESVVSCSFLNKVSPTDALGAFSYVLDTQDVAGILQEVTVQTFGVKGLDTVKDLSATKFPTAMFGRQYRPREYEDLVREHCPELSGKLVVQSTRKLVRQLPATRGVFLL